MKNMKVNALAVTLVRVLNILFPLITGPYIARILNPIDYGYFNVADTLVNLFIPFATIGIYNYGIRAISQVKQNKEQVNYTFSKLFYMSLFSTFVTTIAYLFYLQTIHTNSLVMTLYYLMAIQLSTQILSIEWLNEAFENYTFILYKTIIVRIVMLVSIFVFVRSANDIIPYTVVTIVATILNNLLSFVWIKKDIKLVKVPLNEFLILLKPLIALLFLANANMLYTFLDRVFLAKSSYPEYVTYYTMAQKIVILIAGVISGAVSVSVPRLGFYLGKNDFKAYEALVNKGSRLFNFFIVPISFGLALVGPMVTLLYGGEQYASAGIVTSIFAIRTIFSAMETILGTQVIFVQGHENKLTLYSLIGGGLNVIANNILFAMHIYRPEYYILTTLFSEIVVLIFFVAFIYKNNLLNLSVLFKQLASYCCYASSFIPIFMFIKWIYPVEMAINMPFMIQLMLIIVCCISAYCIILYYTKDVVFHSILNQLKHHFQKLKGRN